MSDGFVIEASGRTAGIAVRDARGFRFFAAGKPFFAIDRHLFPNLRSVQRAAEVIAGGLEGRQANRRGIWPGPAS